MRTALRGLLYVALVAALVLAGGAAVDDHIGPRLSGPLPGSVPVASDYTAEVRTENDAAEATPLPSKSTAAITIPPKEVKVPILMYHYVRRPPEAKDALGVALSVSPADFDRQMAHLVEHGYETIGFGDLLASVREGRDLPRKPVILTFDDGYRDFYAEAYPVLRRYGLKATVFVVPDFVGKAPYMDWSMLAELVNTRLITVGSHTLTHRNLTALPLTEVEKELKESKRVLEERLGRSVSVLAYPFGRQNSEVEKKAAAVGYQVAVTTRFGASHIESQLLQLSRVRIDGRNPSVTAFSSLLGAR